PTQLLLGLPPGTGEVQAKLGDDALPIDGLVHLLPQPRRPVAVCDLLPAERREQLLLDRALAALDGVNVTLDPLQAQVVFAVEPGSPVAGQTEVVFALGDGARHAYAGPFVVERSHPWMAGVQLHGVVWQAEERSLPGQVLVAVGNQALVSEEFLDQCRRLWIDVDAAQGNLVRALGWPVLLDNVIEACRRHVPGPE